MEQDRLILKRLVTQRNELKRDVLSLAKFNYAREPDFVRDRLKLRNLVEEVSQIVRHTQELTEKIKPVQKALEKKFSEAKILEEKSEAMAQDFLQQKITHEEFIKQYVELRKETIKKRLLADGLSNHITLARKYSSAHATTVEPNSPNSTWPTICG